MQAGAGSREAGGPPAQDRCLCRTVHHPAPRCARCGCGAGRFTVPLGPDAPGRWRDYLGYRALYQTSAAALLGVSPSGSASERAAQSEGAPRRGATRDWQTRSLEFSHLNEARPLPVSLNSLHSIKLSFGGALTRTLDAKLPQNYGQPGKPRDVDLPRLGVRRDASASTVDLFV